MFQNRGTSWWFFASSSRAPGRGGSARFAARNACRDFLFPEQPHPGDGAIEPLVGPLKVTKDLGGRTRW